MSKHAKSMFHYRNSGSIIMCHVHIEYFRYLKYLKGSVPLHILYIWIHFMHQGFWFSYIPFWKGHKMQPNFNLNYLSSIFLDLARYETTTFPKSSFTQMFDIGKSALNSFRMTYPTGGCIWYIFSLPLELANFDISIDNFAGGLGMLWYYRCTCFVMTTISESSYF